ncbi:GPW/gp25 family protein [Nocardioides sp. GY 10127]|uniref:GPW/gp25 family protein n=1 Tax=Nocardioides sp. GY 10127 TaxID=2569762 RepID=UPI0010A8155C|nr:GPW/gp25 family protein [Nocardioides sp. GY 10127]TIC78773.1 hypothetical protein E8D37_18935 [Nocardioides sp. GY 10127]
MARTLSLPLAVTVAGQIASLEQGSTTEVARSVGLLMATRVGERRSASSYGTPDPVFGGVDPADLADAITTHEPRATPTDFVLETTDDDPATEYLTVYPQASDDSTAADDSQEG